MNDLFEKPSLANLSDRELLESIYMMLSTAQPVKTAQKRSEGAPKARHEYEPAFEELWKAYPARNGSNPKWKAQQAWRMRRKEHTRRHITDSPDSGMIENAMLEGVKRYAAWCEATSKTGTEMVQQAPRFLGPSREYENKWDIPAPEVEVIKLPRDNDALVAFAAERGIKTKPGEDWWEFRRRVEESL